MTKKHLEEKLDGMKKQLQGNEEKLAVYERRTGSIAVPQNADENLSHEQQLEAEVAELRSALSVLLRLLS
jgi:nucleoprotein TPR